MLISANEFFVSDIKNNFFVEKKNPNRMEVLYKFDSMKRALASGLSEFVQKTVMHTCQ